MRVVSAPALAAITKGEAIVAGAIDVACTPPLRIWGGYGDITLGGNVFNGIGDRGLVSMGGGALGDSEQNVTLTLSGAEPNVIALLSAANVQRIGVAIWEVIFDGSGASLLDASVVSRGRLDTLVVKDKIGGEAVIEVNVETAARGLGRAGQRMRSDADQRLIDAADAGFSATSYAGVKLLYWGGRRPSTIGGGSGAGGQGPAFNEYKQL